MKPDPIAAAQAGSPSDALALICPDCGIHLDPEAGACASCARAVHVDDTGIIRLAREDFYYREMPRETLRDILDEGGREAMLDRFDALSLARGKDYSRYIRRYALDARRGAAVTLLDLGPHSRVLDYGAGWGNLSRVLAGCCARVVSMDLTYESLRFAQALNAGPNAHRITYIHGGDGPRLPFADASFDALVLNGVLEWLPEGADLHLSPEEVQLRFLSEVHRVLAPGGQLLVGIENRYGYRYFMGVPEDHTALRFGALLPRRLSDLYSRKVRGRPYRTYTYGHRASRRLLESAGFSADIHHPWPNYRKFDLIFSPESVRRYRPIEIAGAGLKRRVFIALSASLARIGLFERLTPAFYVLATKRDRNDLPFSLVQDALKLTDDVASGRPTIGLSSTQTVHLKGRNRFVKLPLSDEAARRLELAAAGWQAMREGGEAQEWLLERVRLDRLGRLPVYSEELCRPLRPEEKDQAEACITGFLDRSRRAAEMSSLDLAERFGVLRAFALRLEYAGADFDNCVARLESRSWSSSFCHGDLHVENVVRAPDGRLVLVDWDRFEAQGPWKLDAMHFVVRTMMRESRASWSRSIANLREVTSALGGKGGAESSLKALGIDTRPESLEGLLDLYVLDRLAKDLDSVPHYAYIGHPWRGEAEKALSGLLDQRDWSARSARTLETP